MDWWQAVILGIVEGLTEYLPVSSTGHLILAQRAMGIADSDAANAYAICIQAGAIMAVLGLYYKHVKQMSLGVLGKDAEGRRLATNVVVAFMPAAVFGLLFDEKIDSYLFGIKPVVAAWFVGGVAILGVSWGQKRGGHTPREGRGVHSLTWQAALVIGLIQCLALWPGVSRSLVTIVGGVVVGLSLPAAVEFSFLLGVVTLGAATGYKALDDGPAMLESYGWATIAVGFVCAWVSAVLAVKWMVSYLNRHGMEVFGYYRVVLAIVVAGLVYAGWFTVPAGP